jgi:hypothetical protein
VTISTFDASVGGGTGELAQAMNAMRQLLSVSTIGHNAQVPIFAAGATDASGNLLMDLGTVPVGRTWRLRQLVVGGSGWTTTASGTVGGTALLLIAAGSFQGYPQADVQPSTNFIRDYSATLPNKAFYDAGQAVCKGGEHIYVYVTNGASGQAVPYVAAGRVDDVPAEWPLSS